MEPPPSSPKVELHPHDVLLGRGDWTVRYEGNVRFRDLIREQRVLFGAASGRNARDKIAADVILRIAERGGRFLRRQVDASTAATAAEGVAASDSQWVVVDKKVAMKKVKQAFRDKDSWTQAVPPSATAAAPLNAPPSGSADPAREALERTLRAYQSERREAERTRELEQQLRHAMLQHPTSTAELDRLRQLASLPSMFGESNTHLVQQTLFSLQQQERNLQQLEFNLRNSSLLSQLGGLPASYGLGGGGGGHDPFRFTTPLDVMQQLQQLQQQQALLGDRGLTSLLAQNQYRAGLLDPSLLPDSSLSSLQAALRCHLDNNETARSSPPRAAFTAPEVSVLPLPDRHHIAASTTMNDSIGVASERTTESRRSSPGTKSDDRKRRSVPEVDSAKEKRPRRDVKTTSSSSET
jgi:hypothetical protein